MKRFGHALFIVCGFFIACEHCDGGPKPMGGEQCGFTQTCDPEQPAADADCFDFCAGYCDEAGGVEAGWCLEADARCLCACNSGACALTQCTDGRECAELDGSPTEDSKDRACEEWCAVPICDGEGDVRRGFCAPDDTCVCICGYSGVSTCDYDVPSGG